MNLEIPFLAGMGVVAGSWLFLRSFRDLRTRRLIQNTPTARIRSMPMGLVEVNGEALGRSSVSAPFSGNACVYWEVDIAVRSRRNAWTVVHRNSSGHPFFIRDETGVAMVYPHGADCRVGFGVSEECLGITLPDCYAQYLADEHLTASAVWRLGAMRFRERKIEEGQRLYALATASPRAMSLTVSDGEQLAATGTDDAVAHRIRTLDEESVGVLRRGENEKTFILSQQSERELTLNLGLRAYAELIGGPVITLIGLGILLEALSSGRLAR